MDKFLIDGPSKIKGKVSISGSKNASLPILAATLLFDLPVTIQNLPRVKDISTMLNLLKSLGSKIELSKDKKTAKISNNKIKFVSYSNKLKPEINKIYQSMNVSEFKRMKSSLKFCVIASNEYDGYVAEPRACEWDIAAGHAILENAGGIVTDFEGNEILYGKENFKNPSIILKRNKNI